MRNLKKFQKIIAERWGIKMFEKMKEKKREREEERQRKLQEERNRLLAMSEKELLVEILLELRNIEDSIDNVNRSVIVHSNS